MGSNLALSLQRIFKQFYRNQSGAGTVMSLFGLTICLLLGGVAIDSTNAWRNKELLSLTADVAAHAGAVAIAQGSETAAIIDAVETAAEFNMPHDRFGRIFRDTKYDILLRHYDSKTNTITTNGTPNAIKITLRRNKAVNNPVPTFLLGFIGLNSWDMTVQSVAMVGSTTRCDASEGLFAHDIIELVDENQIGADYCIHSQRSVTLTSRNEFAKSSLVSMPDLSKCSGNCDRIANAGLRTQEVNLIMPDLNSLIHGIFDGFRGDPLLAQEVVSFFDGKPLDDDFSALDEIGVPKQLLGQLKKGTVVPLLKEQFLLLREFPEGLSYSVDCNDQEPILEIGVEPFSPALRNIVLTTDCALRFGPHASIRGSLIVTTRNQHEDTLSVDPGAKAGDPLQDCNPNEHSVFMSIGKMTLPAGFTNSNVTFVGADNIRVDGDLDARISVHRGLGIHASGRITIEGSHKFIACDNSSDLLIPTLRILRHVTPTRKIRATTDQVVGQ